MKHKWTKFDSLDYLDNFNEAMKGMYLDKEIVAEVKYDGFNISVLKNDGFLLIYTKNQLAQIQIQEKVKKVLEKFNPEFTDYLNEGYQFYFEALFTNKNGEPAKSPTRRYTHTEDKLICIDILNPNGIYVDRETKEKICNGCNIPIPEIHDRFTVSTVDDLIDIVKENRIIAKKNNIEGFVYKCYDSDGHYYFKDRWDRYEKDSDKPKPKVKKIKSPTFNRILCDDEVNGVIAKLQIELSEDEFNDKRIAMPLIAKEINKEAIKHKARPPSNLFSYYLKFKKA